MATKNELEIAKSLGSIETSIKNIETDISESNKKHAEHYKADAKMQGDIKVLNDRNDSEGKRSIVSGGAAGTGGGVITCFLYWLFQKFTGN